jgi:hypothetical protein
MPTQNLTGDINLDKEVDDFYGDERGLDSQGPPPAAADNVCLGRVMALIFVQIREVSRPPLG